MVRPMARHWLPSGSTSTSGAWIETSARALALFVVGTVTSKVGAGVAVAVCVPSAGVSVDGCWMLVVAVQVSVGVMDG